MKTLVHSICWCPEDQPVRQKGLAKHLTMLGQYAGDYEILLTVNGTYGPAIQKIISEASKTWTVPFIIDIKDENKGWAWARNSAIKKTIEEEYDLLIMMDGDIWVDEPNWIIKAQEASKVQPVFMCRMHEPQYMKGGKTKWMSQNWEVYDEWLGCINVARRHVLKTVGGYNNVDLPQMWGYHDCLWGRQLLAAGFFKPFLGYPSLANLKVTEEQDKDYDKFLDPVKETCVKKYHNAFWSTAAAIVRGQRSYYFDYNIGQ